MAYWILAGSWIVLAVALAVSLRTGHRLLKLNQELLDDLADRDAHLNDGDV